jgi:hypothetical protein
MRRIPLALLIAGALVLGCKRGKVEGIDRSDATPPSVTLTVTAVDAKTGRSTHVEAGVGRAGGLSARPGTVTIAAGANDPSGVHKVSVWTIGDTVTERANGEVVNPPDDAYRETSTLVSMELGAGQTAGVFASARNFNSGTDPAASTAFTGIVLITVPGELERLPAEARSQTVRFRWSDAARAYVAEGVPAPARNATIIGVSPGNPFGAGRFMSLYRGRTDIESLDLRADFIRLFQNTRGDFDVGPWSDAPWYALQNLSRSRAVVADEFTIDVHWLVRPR